MRTIREVSNDIAEDKEVKEMQVISKAEILALQLFGILTAE